MALSGGTATPLVTLAGMGLLGTGITSASQAIISTAQGKFCMVDWLADFAVNAGLTIVTFGAGYGGGALVGAALTTSTQLSSKAILGM